MKLSSYKSSPEGLMDPTGSIVAPSGRVFDINDIRLVRFMAKVGFIRYIPAGFRTRSGPISKIRVGGHEDTTDNPDFQWQMGWCLRNAVQNYVEEIGEARQPCLLGIPTAGTPFAEAAALTSLFPGSKRKIAHRVVREYAKDHGANQKSWVNGTADHGRHFYIAVDNTITDAESKLNYAKLFEVSGYRPKEMLWSIMVDRQQGGVERMENAGYKTNVLFLLLDIIHVLDEVKDYSRNVVEEIRQEVGRSRS